VTCENVEDWRPFARLLGEPDDPPPADAV